MKYLKTFESREEEQKKKEKENLEIFKELYYEHPDHKTHDLYMFIGKDGFKESENGLYKKTIEIEKMVRITPDQQSMSAITGMKLRATFTQQYLYHIRLPKEMRDDVDNKGSNEIEDYIVDLINKYKLSRPDKETIKKTKTDVADIRDRLSDMDRFNL